MIEQMEQQMDAEAAADERKLRERILATGQLHKRLLDEYQEKFGAPPTPIRLDAPEGAQFVAVEEDRLDQLAMERMDGESQLVAGSGRRDEDMFINGAIDDGQLENSHVLDRHSQIEQFEAGRGFADVDPDGMS